MSRDDILRGVRFSIGEVVTEPLVSIYTEYGLTSIRDRLEPDLKTCRSLGPMAAKASVFGGIWRAAANLREQLGGYMCCRVYYRKEVK